jgi:hypothetical protein
VPINVNDFLAPHETAVVTCEMQRGTIGDLAFVPGLPDERVVVSHPDGEDVPHRVFEHRSEPLRLLPVNGDSGCHAAFLSP